MTEMDLNYVVDARPSVLLYSNHKDICDYAAEQIAELLKGRPNAVIGLATGGTPEPMYKKLVELYKNGLNFSYATFFNLDEYCGLPPDHPGSYHAYMRHHLFEHINADPKKIFIPDGMAADPATACADYEASIKAAGGIDLQILGIGANGHIGFCEPGVDLDIPTHLAILTPQTRKDNARFFDGRVDDVPKSAISMGLSTIIKAGRIILLASGEAKRPPIELILRGPATSEVPATILRQHPEVQLVLDAEAYPANLDNSLSNASVLSTHPR